MMILGGALVLLAGALALFHGPLEPLGALIFEFHPPFLNTLQAGVQRRLAPELWDAVFVPVLTAPAWVIPFVVGDLLLVVGILRRRRRRHG